MDPEEWAVYLHHLLGVKEGAERLGVLTPEAIKARTADALRQMGLRGSRQRPIVFVCEDLQWIDRTSEECVASLIEATAGASVLSLLTYRPGYRPPWMDKSYATQIALQPLSRSDSQRIVESLLPTHSGHAALAPTILTKAEGNPFFLEELCRAVAEQPDAARRGRGPRHGPGGACGRASTAWPRTTKDALRLASVIGREVPLRLLQAVWRGPGDIEHHLRELTRLEFLYEQTRPGESVYVFKHALTQEVVYESLPVAQPPRAPCGRRACARAPLRGPPRGGRRPARLPLRADRPVRPRRRVPLARGGEGRPRARARRGAGSARGSARPRGAAPRRGARPPAPPTRPPQGVVADPPRPVSRGPGGPAPLEGEPRPAGRRRAGRLLPLPAGPYPPLRRRPGAHDPERRAGDRRGRPLRGHRRRSARRTTCSRRRPRSPAGPPRASGTRWNRSPASSARAAPGGSGRRTGWWG